MNKEEPSRLPYGLKLPRGLLPSDSWTVEPSDSSVVKRTLCESSFSSFYGNLQISSVLWVLLLLSSMVFARGEDFSTVSASADRDLQDALSRLATLREEIAEARIPLAREWNRRQAEVREKRREVERLQRLRDNRQMDLVSLEKEVEAQRNEINYVGNLLGEYLRAFESRIHVAEIQRYEESLAGVRRVLDRERDDPAERLEAALVSIELGVLRTQRQIGGQSFAGKALGADGVQSEGTFGLFGPLGFFAGQGEAAVGAVRQSASLEPAVVPLGAEVEAAIRQWVRDGKGDMPLDPTLGDALAVAGARESLWEHTLKGGIWIYPILGFALVAFLVALFKGIEIFRIKEPNPALVHQIIQTLQEGDKKKARELALTAPDPYGAMLTDAVDYADSNKALLEEVMLEHLLRLQPKLERFLPVIAVTAATAPLLGLLGTVTGMINTFKLITLFGTGDARALSSGISEALVTTEYGLVVAIPALIIHALLARRVQGILSNMEKVGIAFQNGVSESPAHASSKTDREEEA